MSILKAHLVQVATGIALAPVAAETMAATTKLGGGNMSISGTYAARLVNGGEVPLTLSCGHLCFIPVAAEPTERKLPPPPLWGYGHTYPLRCCQCRAGAAVLPTHSSGESSSRLKYSDVHLTSGEAGKEERGGGGVGGFGVLQTLSYSLAARPMLPILTCCSIHPPYLSAISGDLDMLCSRVSLNFTNRRSYGPSVIPSKL